MKEFEYESIYVFVYVYILEKNILLYINLLRKRKISVLKILEERI